MFDARQLQQVDPAYFNVIILDPYDVTIQSKNTGHYWIIHNSEYPSQGSCVIYHKHRYSHPYHQHGRARSLRSALKQIRQHDDYQLNVREGRNLRQTRPQISMKN